MRLFPLLPLIAFSVVVSAADGGASITPAPGFEPPRPGAAPRTMMQQQPMMMPRPTIAYEVEMLPIKPGDTAALAQWSELAALGYHVVAAVPGDGLVTLYLERAQTGGAPGSLRLPAAIPADTAAKLRTRIEAAQAERQRTIQPPRPPMPPQSAGEEKK